MHHFNLLLLSASLLISASCSQPKSTSPYPQNPAVSDAQGHPRDTTTFYFPAADSLHAKYVPKNEWPASRNIFDIQYTNCAYELEHASYALTYFDAPVLSNYYLGAEIFRFLWLRSFHRPVLLTLCHDSTGTSLRTQLLDKSPGFYILGVQHPDSLPANSSAKAKAYARKYYAETMADPAFLAEVAEGKRRAVQVFGEETTISITLEQYQEFQQLLQKAQFWQLPSCKPVPGLLDGSNWLLEAHQASGYHMVFRHSPNENDGFRKACEYLINLSSVRNEERY
ncbi:hypothetical protein [Hymenobacter norwichensis]|uniref:hypothetical protein n=1 Tax=Hymenobacter norwichensis TaxID=223903 RepID=UPI000524D6AD|nr:hypothetical protein [Hymenobacter norwichensis]